MTYKNIAESLLYGVCIGDALGVPVEFVYREYLNEFPVIEMLGGGIHGQEKGVWSDDSSLTFCLAETIAEGYNHQLLAKKFIAWKYNAYWTATGEVFDIGNATSWSISNLSKGINPIEAGGKNESDNGNGSLMRILPLVLLLQDLPIDDRFKLTKEVSSITHAHPRSILACFYYLEFALELIKGEDRFKIYEKLKINVLDFFNSNNDFTSEIHHFERLLKENIYELGEDSIQSSGYVIHTLESSIWCFLTTNSYNEAVLKAINLGEDTDTTGAVTGGLAALFYGYESISKEWINAIKGKNDIDNLINRF
jgi:ADP-ribosyl-[dinitrogen reductase] hydrolase